MAELLCERLIEHTSALLINGARGIGVEPRLAPGRTSRIRVIHFKVTTPSCVVVAPATVQAIVDVRPIDIKNNRPDREKKQCHTKQKTENDS